MIITVPEDFITHRAEKQEQYNQRGRSDRVFLMNLDAELLEFHMIAAGVWHPHTSWMVDAIDEWGNHIDVKFIRKYWNVSREKTLNLIKQRNCLSHYHFYEWEDKPNRPLIAGDRVSVRSVGLLSYNDVADNLKKSFKEPDGFYVDVRKLLQ